MDVEDMSQMTTQADFICVTIRVTLTTLINLNFNQLGIYKF